jgi:hypothetical protein
LRRLHRNLARAVPTWAKLVETDTDIADKPPSTKRLSKRLAALWPHLEKTFVAELGEDRNHFTIYTLKAKSADYADYQTAFLPKSLLCTRETLYLKT